MKTLPSTFAFTGTCPLPEEGSPEVPCQLVILQTQPEPPETLANYALIEALALKSVEITSPLYLALFGIAILRRYIIGRI